MNDLFFICLFVFLLYLYIGENPKCMLISYKGMDGSAATSFHRCMIHYETSLSHGVMIFLFYILYKLMHSPL